MFNSRDHLIAHLATCPLRPSILRAIDDPWGKEELLGGFSKIPPGGQPGFILAITSRHGQTWYVAAVVPTTGYKPIVRVLETVPWQWWVGDDGIKKPLYAGDRPDEYKEKRSIQRRSGDTTPRHGLP